MQVNGSRKWFACTISMVPSFHRGFDTIYHVKNKLPAQRDSSLSHDIYLGKSLRLEIHEVWMFGEDEVSRARSMCATVFPLVLRILLLSQFDIKLKCWHQKLYRVWNARTSIHGWGPGARLRAPVGVQGLPEAIGFSSFWRRLKSNLLKKHCFNVSMLSKYWQPWRVNE